MVSCWPNSSQNPGQLATCTTIRINGPKLSRVFLNVRNKFRYNLYENDTLQYSYNTTWGRILFFIFR